MKLIYQNFDGLDVTFQGALPKELLEQLDEARLTAQANKKDTYLELGAQKLKVMVGETGARGGYRYRFDTGLDAETWFIAHSTKRDGWNVRVSVHSLALALHGYEGVKGRILHKLADMEVEGVGGPPLERISRLDYCFDFLTAEPFNPDPTHFIAHQHCKKHCYGEKGIISSYASAQGDRILTVRVGEMPGRQATLYNKTVEIGVTGKDYWKEIWKLDPKRKETVWRVEVRAGKDELDKFNLKRFSEFEERVGDVISTTLKAIRYVEPSQDSNRWRWPNSYFWDAACEAASQALKPYSCDASREKILREHKLNVIKRYKTLILGSVTGYAAACGSDPSEIEAVIEALGCDLMEAVQADPKRFKEKFEAAENRFRFLT